MHPLFVTRGIVLSKRNIGEAHTLVTILTKELGLVRAKATSTRAEQSKLRYGLESLTSGRYTFVRGRYEWKVTGVESVSREYVPHSASCRSALGRVSKLLLRLVRGEGESKELFETVSQGFALVAQTSDQEQVSATECVLVLRILMHLGYLPQTEVLQPFTEGAMHTSVETLRGRASHAFLIRAINESLMQTGL